MKKKRILFILKERFYNHHQSKSSYGLLNSAKQVADFLETIGYECKIVKVVDANGIDKEVYEYRPDIVVIEALWVTGAKMKELIEIKRYRHIQWIVRVHSDIGFLAAETQAMKYINDYFDLAKENLHVSANNEEFNKYCGIATNHDFLYLPNIVTMNDHTHHHPHHNPDIMDVACFGSLRILKNQCYQALCAIDAANRLGKKLRFHITVDVAADEPDSNRFPVLKNLEEIFKDSYHELVKHTWLENGDFHELIKKMDIGLQISYTESYNIVAADFVIHHVPIVVSDAIDWMPSFFKTSTVNYQETIDKIIIMYNFRNSTFLKWWAKHNLRKFNNEAKLIWAKALRNL